MIATSTTSLLFLTKLRKSLLKQKQVTYNQISRIKIIITHFQIEMNIIFFYWERWAATLVPQRKYMQIFRTEFDSFIWRLWIDKRLECGNSDVVLVCACW